RSPWRARRAPGAPRSPRQGHRSTRAAPAPPRAAPADPPPCPAILRRSCSLLSLDPSKDAVHEPPRVFGGVALRERDRLVDHDLGRHLAAIELVDRDPQRAALDRAEPVGGPVVRRGRDPLVELRRARGGLLREPPRPGLRLAGLLAADLGPARVP